MGKQWIAVVAIGLGLTAGTIGAWAAFQRWQLELHSPADQEVVRTAVDEPAPVPAESVESLSKTAPNGSDRAVQPVPTLLTQAENDYLYELSQALQAPEKAKMDDAARLTIGRAVAEWAEAGASYWELRQKFDATYAADPFDREIYLKYAIESFAPTRTAALTEPQPQPTVGVPTRTEFMPNARPGSIQAPDRWPDSPASGRPEAVPAPGKPPSDTAPGGSLIVAPEPQPDIVAPEPEPTPDSTPTPPEASPLPIESKLELP